LKTFVSNLDPKAPNAYNEHQRLDIDKLHMEIIKMEQEQANKAMIDSYDRETVKQQKEATHELEKELKNIA
jgi:valyl-tRNA synthetase